MNNEPNTLSWLFLNMIIDDRNCYNGHSQLEIPKELVGTDEVRKEVMDDLQHLLECHTKFRGFVSIEIMSDGSGGFQALDYWKNGEHPMGHKDKLLLSFS